MTRFRIDKSSADVRIALTEVGEKREALLGAFNECAEGRCSCPTNEYEKVASMEVESGQDRIDIRLQAKPGREFYVTEIATCLAHTIQTTDRS